MFYTDSPTDDFENYTAEQERKLDRLPRCSQCEEPIQQEDAVLINHEFICDRCLEDLRVDLLQERWS